jgi:histidyl-tRNA synthetase
VRELLGKGRKDESGDFTKGAELGAAAIDHVAHFVDAGADTRDGTLKRLAGLVGASERGGAGVTELEEMSSLFTAAGYREDRIRIDPAVVRGLGYYTGPVFECELLMEARNEEGQLVRFGSVGGGGRYDDLIARFTGQRVPATGFSIGVSRLYSALKLLGRAEEGSALAPVVVLVMDRDRLDDYQRMVSELRKAGIRAEMYVGTSGMKAQMKYADKRGSPLVVIQGGEEKAKGVVQIKDLALGAALAGGVESRSDYKEARLAQFSVKETELVKAVREALARR